MAGCPGFPFNRSAPLKGIVWCQADRLQLVSSAGGLCGFILFICNFKLNSDEQQRLSLQVLPSVLGKGDEFFSRGVNIYIKCETPKAGLFLKLSVLDWPNFLSQFKLA